MMNNNSTFHFKQFELLQSNTQLKVTTEATLFAAWVSTKNCRRILDIGAGIGVLSLMLAQKSKAEIDAVEIQQEAAEICAENFKNSPWSKQLSVYNCAIQNFKPKEKYDAIVCNPPFFFAHLKGNNTGKNKAIHNETLSFEDLVDAILRLLKNSGKFYVLLPSAEMNALSNLLSEQGLYLQEKLELIHKAGKPVLRVAACFAFQNNLTPKIQQLIMRNADESYTDTYREMLREYLIIF